ncbi:hypothetical protein ACFOQM_12525 [Paenibacillus sp. GCM10012307]|uniref:Uncharacterized protein n=1 Tax=Paenibacillus roseus TaxID=2798579 RepID=A0A934IZJ7_9BACL|nr:hypothetical protein [Paenibacillus roseus]MBJ6362117.1 hypothetical protein [Paenibacillus roseus]
MKTLKGIKVIMKPIKEYLSLEPGMISPLDSEIDSEILLLDSEMLPLVHEHDYEYLRSDFSVEAGDVRNLYMLIDIFYCRTCLNYEEKIAKKERSSKPPGWYKG